MSGTLLIRADASVAIGTGHVMRCVALAQAWQDAGGRAIFAMAESTPAVTEHLRRENIEVNRVEVKAGSEADARITAKLADEVRAAWVVIDGYQFSAAYHRELKSAALKLLVVDDEGIADSAVDLILNQNANARESMYPRRGEHTRLLLGTRFALLRREFRRWKEGKRGTLPTAQTLLVTMGGSDPDNVTSLVIQALRIVKMRSLHAIVIAGGSNPNLESLRKSASDLNGRIEVKDVAFDMPELMSRADISVIAGGGTLWELLYLSCPVLSFARNSVQAGILAELSARKIIEYLGDPRNFAPETLASAIDELAASQLRREKMSKLGPMEVDGDGVRRVCEWLLQ